MNRILTIILLGLLFQTSYAQVTNDPALLVRNRGGLSGYIQTFQPDPEIDGNYLYFKEPMSVTLYLKDGKGTYKIDKANVDLINKSILVDIKNNMYSINYSKIDSALFQDLRVVDYRLRSTQVNESTMALILDSNNKSTLYKTVDIQLIKPTYNEAMDTGNRNYTLKQKVKYFIEIKDQGILDLSKKLKSFKGTEYFDQVKKFTRKNAIDFTADRDVMQLNDFILTLI